MGKASSGKWLRRANRGFVSVESTTKPSSFLGFNAPLDTNVSLIITVAISALQASGVSVSAWLAVPCWIVVFVLLVDLIWNSGDTSRSFRRGLLTAFFGICLAFMSYRSIKGPIVKTGHVSVSYIDSKGYAAEEIDSGRRYNLNDSKDAEIINAVPTMNTSVPLHDGKPLINIKIINTSSVKIENFRISVYSVGVTIKPLTAMAYKFDDNSYVWEETQLYPFGRDLDMKDISIEVQNETFPQMIKIYVTVDGSNMTPYTGLIKISATRP